MSLLTEDLSDLPLQQEIRDKLRAMIAAGHDPLEVAEAAFAVAGGLAVAIEGPLRTGARLYGAGAAMLNVAELPGRQSH